MRRQQHRTDHCRPGCGVQTAVIAIVKRAWLFTDLEDLRSAASAARWWLSVPVRTHAWAFARTLLPTYLKSKCYRSAPSLRLPEKGGTVAVHIGQQLPLAVTSAKQRQPCREIDMRQCRGGAREETRSAPNQGGAPQQYSSCPLSQSELVSASSAGRVDRDNIAEETWDTFRDSGRFPEASHLGHAFLCFVT